MYREKGSPSPPQTRGHRSTDEETKTPMAVGFDTSLTAANTNWEAEAARLRLLKRGRAVFVVTVTYQPSGAVRPKVFMTPDAAQKHATQHLERGHDVEVVLSTLTPTATLTGGESA